MPDYTFYEPNGKITCNVYCKQEELALNPQWGDSYVEGRFLPSQYYIGSGSPTPKQDYTPTVSGNTISGLPVPCEAKIEGTIYSVPDGSITLNSNLIGPYTVKITAVTHLDKEIVIP